MATEGVHVTQELYDKLFAEHEMLKKTFLGFKVDQTSALFKEHQAKLEDMEVQLKKAQEELENKKVLVTFKTKLRFPGDPFALYVLRLQRTVG